MIVFLSIKPKYAFAILHGTKRYEFRKMRFSRNVEKVVLYATAPYKKIVGYFEVGKIRHGSPRVLWHRFNAYAIINRKAFFTYYKNKSSGIAIEVKEPVSFRRHKRPQEILPNFTVPNSFKYISEGEFELIKEAST